MSRSRNFRGVSWSFNHCKQFVSLRNKYDSSRQKFEGLETAEAGGLGTGVKRERG